ncbi:MAG: hypothetical protein H0W37_09875, partial [Pseudonocardiales bacterium]|nr:hypothetical protein [Pseudonocardiales bacterium]
PVWRLWGVWLQSAGLVELAPTAIQVVLIQQPVPLGNLQRVQLVSHISVVTIHSSDLFGGGDSDIRVVVEVLLHDVSKHGQIDLLKALLGDRIVGLAFEGPSIVDLAFLEEAWLQCIGVSEMYLENASLRLGSAACPYPLDNSG